jgi:filamentous hemagglutinin family protein
MNAHASINRIFRLIWNESLGSWIPAPEIARGRGKRNGRSAALAPLLAALCLGVAAHAGPAVGVAPLPTQLPTGGTVVGGSATITQGSTPGIAVLNINQTTQRAVIDWNTFNVGSAAQVNFVEPNRNSATLNEVLDSNASQIFGKITGNGQIFLSNPNGVYFGKSASVDVGSLTVTTNGIGNADFMAGKITLARNGSTGSVVNDGNLQAALGGYIALLAPQVRNGGVVIARLGTVAMASGESITLNLNGNHLAGITVQPSAIAALVENKGAVLAPGGLIILSAQAADHLLGGVVKNSGTLEATGLSAQGGRIVLEASDSVENSGTINADANAAAGGPAGSVTITAPAILNSGSISAAAAAPSVPVRVLAPVSGGNITLSASSIVQTATGAIDASGANGGSVKLEAAQDITVAGSISAAADDSSAVTGSVVKGRGAAAGSAGYGGNIALGAGHNITLQSALIDARGSAGGGEILVQGGGQPPSGPPADPPTLALLGGTQLLTSSRRGKGGNVTLTADQVGLFDTSSIDASGAAGGGNVFVGGGFHGQDASIANAQQTVIGSTATIDASATLSGDGGQVVVWSDGQTTFAGSISARGGALSGSGGTLEVSSKGILDFLGSVNAGADHGKAGTLLLDPENITVDDSGLDPLSNDESFSTNPSTDSIIAPATITAVTNSGTAVTLQANNDITINSSIVTVAGGHGGALTFQAGRNITVNASVISDNGDISFTANDSGAVSADRVAGTASFNNYSVIDAGTGTVSITMGTFGASGTIETGHVVAANFTVTHDGPTAGAVSGAIDLGETDVTNNLTITTNSARNLTNTIGNVVIGGTATISVGTGDVTIDGTGTDFTIIGLTAGNVLLNNRTAVRFATTNVSGTLTETTLGPIASTGSVQVGDAASFTANNGGFAYADPYINLSNAGNHFAGGLTLSVPSSGQTGTGGYATIVDSGALSMGTTSVATSLTVSTGGAISLGTTHVGTNLTVTAGGTITQTGTITVPYQTILTAGATHDITLDDANNTFNSVQIVSGDNVTLVDKNAINFGSINYGSGYPSHIYGNLSVTAGGDITQMYYQYYDGYSAITVGGATTFTANNASSPINLYLGPNPFNGYSPYTGQSNDFVGGVTLARNNTNTGFSNVWLRNIDSTASVLTGLTDVGTLSNVYLTFNSAPSVALPGMTVTGNFYLYAPSVANTGSTPANIISQTGAITVGGQTILEAASTGDITLSNPLNDFNDFGVVQSRNTTLSTSGAVALYAPGFNQTISGNLSVTAGGNISDVDNYPYEILVQSGNASFNAGSQNVSLTQDNYWNIVAFPAANNVTLYPYTGVILGDSTIAGTLNIESHNTGYTLTQVSGSAVDMTGNGTTTFANFTGGIMLANTDNVFGPLAISNAGAVNVRENDAITQASTWSDTNAITLTTSNDQAITLSQSGNDLGPLIITQVNSGAGSADAVNIVDNANSMSGLTQGGAWTVAGTTTLNSGSYSINLNNANNVFGPLRVQSSTGTTNGVASSVAIYAKNTVSADAITDVGGTGAWSTGADVVKLVAYDTTGSTAGAGNITLSNAANVLGNLYLKGNNVTITENASITDGPSLSNWDGAGDSGWATTGTTNLVVANPSGKTITLSNLTNLIGPIALSTTGTAGTLTSVLITDDENLTQAGAWVVGSAPVTLDARTNQINLPNSANVMGNINITTANGTPTAVTITENAAITQGSAWALTGVPVVLTAENNHAVTLTNASNILGNLTVTGGAVSITENGNITQPSGAGGAWTTTGTTTLNPTAGAITLTNSANVLGPIAIGGTPSAVSITEADDITQAAAWVASSTPFTLNSGTHDIVLSQAGNQLGALTLTGQNATVTENNSGGITQGSAWTIPGTTTLTAGSANPIVLTSSPASSFGTVSIVSASNATIDAVGAINFGTSTISSGGTLTVSAGGEITQSGAITAPSLRLIGTGDATLTDVSNNVANLAAGFSGGDLSFTNSGNFAVAVIGGTSGITINDHNVTLTSVSGTVTGLANVNASSASLTLSTGTALSLPQMSIAGPQTYTASTVSGTGITLNANVNSTAAGAITFNSPVTLAADLTVQSTNSAIDFASTLAGGTYQLNVNAGSGLVDFSGAVSALGKTTDASAALTLNSGGASFDSTLGANNGLAITGPVVFSDTVTLADGSAASVFTGLVTLGKVGGMNLSGYNGMSFDDGVLLQNGPATINSNNSSLIFQTAGSVSGPYGLTLNSGAAALTGLNRLGSNLTSLTVTALSPTIPSGGVSIAGPQSYTAASSSNITLDGNVTSTAAGAITFNSPVTVGAASTVATSNSNIAFDSTVDGNNNLTLNSGTGTTTFGGMVGSVAPLGSGTGAAIVLQGSGATTFDNTVQVRSGMTAAGAVTFDNNVTLGNGNTGSTFTGLVTSGGASGNSISGYGGIAFNGGLTLVGGPVSVASNGSTLALGGAVSGAENLTLNALAGGAGTVTGLDQIGFTSNLTALNVTAQTLSLPSTGLAVAGPMSFTAAGGITVNGAVGNSSGPATGAITFNSPVLLATGPIAVTTHNAAVNFDGSVNGAETLSVNAGSGTTTFAAVGGATALTSLATGSGGSTAINGGSVRTSGAQTYNDPVTLGAITTLTGDNVQFGSTLNGAYALTVNDSGTATFDGVVGGNTPLASIVVNATGGVAMNTTAVTTSGAQTYNEAMTLGADAGFSGVGLTFGAVDGDYSLTANAGSGALSFTGAVGAVTPLASLSASGNTIAAAAVTTVGAQGYTANGVTLGGDLHTTDSNVTVTGPSTLGGDVTVATGGGNIAFSGATSTINGAHALTLTAGAGNVVLGGQVGGVTPLTAITVSGYDLTLPDISTVDDLHQSYTALDDITLTQSRTLNAPISFTADADNDGSGSFILLNGVSLTASNNTLNIQAADISLQGNSTLASGSGLMTLTASDGRNIALGGTTAPGQMTITGSELARMSSSGGLDLKTTGAGWISVNGIMAAQSQNITGTLSLLAQGTGNVSFITAPSTFNAVTADAGGTINVGVNLTAADHAIEFVTPVAVSGASTIASEGGNISFDNTVAVNNNLTLTTSNGVLTFSGAVGSNQTLTLNLGGGSVVGLGELQSALTGLTVNSSSGITLPAFAISGPQVYNTGEIIATGNLGGVGLAFNNVVIVTPASGTSLALNAGTGTLGFSNLVSFGTTNMSLTADQITFAAAVTGSGSLAMQPFTASRNVAVGGSGAFSGLNLTAADLAWLPIGTLSSVAIGSASGSGTLDVAGVLDAPGTPLTLNGGGGITQSGGSITSGPLTLYAAGNAITLANGANAFGAVAINGTPSAVSLVNTLDIDQQVSAAWNLGSAPVTLNAGTHDITLNNAGNTFGTLRLNGGNVQVAEAAATDVGASSISRDLTVTSSGAINVSGALGVTGNVSLNSAGEVTQSAALTIGGNLDVVTTVNAGDVTVNNSGAAATTIGNTLVGGNYVLTATGEPVSQAAGTSLQVRGNVTVTGASIVLSGAGNLIGGTTTLPATDTTELTQAGVITLGNRTESGNLTVVSEATSRSFGSSQVSGTAILLNDASNDIGGTISMSASPPTIVNTGFVQTGINQTAGTSISVAGVASFTAEASSAGSLGVNLTNSGNSFGTLVLSGNTVNVSNSATGLTTIGSAVATTSLTLNAAGAVAQSGLIQTPALAITAPGPVTLNNVANDVNTLAVLAGGGAINYVNATDFAAAGINAGGGDVSLTAGGTGSITQTAALLNVGTLTVNAGGAITLINPGNSIASLAASTAAGGMQLYDANGLAVSGAVSTTTGDLLIRAAGNLTLATGGSLGAAAGNVVASTEGAGNFINDSAAAGAALTVGSGDRWLVYSDTPDLVAGAHTAKGGLTSNFRHYDATYTMYRPGAVTETGDGFIYDYATPTLTVAAAIVGTPSQVYGSTPTAALGYTITGFVDSEDNAGNVISGGTASYSTALSNTMNAGPYSITYTGGLSSNYSLTPSITGVTYTVTPAVLTYTANTASRAYGAANPALGGTISGFVLGQNSSVLSGSPTWTTTAVTGSNVGQYSIDGSGYAVGGNYSFAQAAANATAFTVNPAGLTITANNDSPTYNGTAYSGGAGVSYSAFANGENSSVLGGTLSYGGTSQGARNVGTYSITPGGLTDANYDINFVSGTLAIGKATLTLTTSPVTKTYDGTLAALGTAEATAGTQVLGGDTVSGGTFAFTNANAGSGDKTVTVTAVTVNDGNGGGNYTVGYVGNTASTISPASLTVDTSNVIKTYDGTLAASGTATVVSGTLFHNASNGNVLDSLSGGTFAFTNANAGSANKTVTTTGVTVNDGNGGGNYVLTYADNTTSTINPATLSFVGTIADKTYDGTTLATLSGYTLTGFIGSQTVDASAGSAAFVDPNAAIGKTVTISGVTLADGTNGGLAANYTVNPTATASATIDPKVLTANATVASKVYDGTTAAALESYGLSGFVGNETVTGVGGTATFADKDVGNAKPVTIAGVTLMNGTHGGLATNYVVSPNAGSDADITPATLHVAGVIALNTVYNGTLAADVDTQAAVLTGVIGADSVQVGSITGSYLTKDVGTNKPVVTSAFVLTGSDAMDYTLVQPTGLTANVTPAALTVSATGVNKVYDGTTAATVILTDNPVAGDVLTITSSNAFLDKNAGTGKYISVSDIVISGADAADYTVNSSTAACANITPATLTVSATAQNKVYDGTTAATVLLTDTPVAGDTVNLSYVIAAFGNKNVGTAKAVTVSGISASGADAGDYTINTVATTTANITPAVLTVSAIAQNKVYDANTDATVNLTDNGVAGDVLSLSFTNGAFANKNAGTAKPVTVNGISVGGADAGNYTFNTTATTTADITPATLTVSAIGSSKPYDGTTAATVTLTDDAFTGELVSLAHGPATFANPAVGNGKTITVGGIQIIGGADQNNYVLADSSVTTTGDITLDSVYTNTVNVQGTWALPPTPPRPLTPPVVTPPAPALDMTLPAGFGGMPGEGSGPSVGGVTNGTSGTSGAAAGENLGTGATSATGGANGTAAGENIGTGTAGGTISINGTAAGENVGAGARGGTNGANGTPAGESAGTSGQVTVSLVQAATVELAGVVSVSVPEDIVEAGKGFSFPLPAELAEAASAGQVRVTLKNGKRLPSWLHYTPGTKTFSATAAPSGALPIESLVRIGAKRWTVVITERTNR